MFVKFWSPWCSHCAAIAPVFAELSNQSVFQEKVVFAEFNCDTGNSFCKKHDIGTPNFMFIDNSIETGVKFVGDDHINAFHSFVEKQLYKYLGVIENDSEVADNADYTATFVFSIPEDDHIALNSASKIAETFKFSDIRFFRKIGPKSFGVYTSKDNLIPFKGDWTDDAIYSFVIENMHPKMARYGVILLRHMLSRNLLCAMSVVKNEEERSILYTPSLPVYSNVQYTYQMGDTSIKLLRHLGLSRKAPPFSVVVDLRKDIWWTSDDTFSAETLKNLVELAISDINGTHADGPGKPDVTILEEIKFWINDNVEANLLSYFVPAAFISACFVVFLKWAPKGDTKKHE